MTDPRPDTPREERLRREARALRDNLLRRKAQARDRTRGRRETGTAARPRPPPGSRHPVPPAAKTDCRRAARGLEPPDPGTRAPHPGQPQAIPMAVMPDTWIRRMARTTA